MAGGPAHSRRFGFDRSACVTATRPSFAAALTFSGNNRGSGFTGGFTFSGSGLAAGAGGIGVPTVTTFGPGALDLSGTFGISPANSFGGYVIVGDQELRGIVSAVFQFTADPIVVGGSPLGRNTFETQFAASGFVQLFDDLGATRPSFTQAVYGIGGLAVTAENVGNGTFVTRSMASADIETPRDGERIRLHT